MDKTQEELLIKILDELGVITGLHKESASKIDPNDILYTVTEVSKLIKTDRNYVYKLINAGVLPVVKLGSIKIRKEALLDFLEKNEGNDLSDPFDVKKLGEVIE